MKTFGDNEIEWRDDWPENRTHVIVATKGAAWSFLCHALPSEYVTWNHSAEPPGVVLVEEKTTEAVVWKHDRAKIDCAGCLAVLDGAVVERVPVQL